jgi:hypothetical protein
LVHPHEIDFHYFITKYTLEGARGEFESFSFSLIRGMNPEVDLQRIQVSQGDGGIDIIKGTFGSDIVIWQCKFFLNDIEKSQKQQITNSFGTAINTAKETRSKMRKWILCLPKNLTVSEKRWWDRWKHKMEKEHNLTITLFSLADYQAEFVNYTILFNAYFHTDQIQDPLPVVEQVDDDSQTYIRRIKESDIPPDWMIEIRRFFYYAEALETNLKQLDSEPIKKILEDIYIRLEDAWRTCHQLRYDNTDDDDGRDVYLACKKHCMEHLTGYTYNLIPSLRWEHLVGFILILTNLDIAFWTRSIRELDD